MAHETYEHSSDVGHVVSLKMLAGILAALLALTVVTVAVTFIDLGEFNLVLAIAIAVVKATLVVLYFMHLRWDRPFNAIVFVFSIILVGLFIIFSLLDRTDYFPQLIPDYAPEMER